MGKDGIMGGDDNKQAKIARSRQRTLEREIEQLRAENQRLKEALEWYMNNCDCCSTDVATRALIKEIEE